MHVVILDPVRLAIDVACTAVVAGIRGYVMPETNPAPKRSAAV
jgi:hypothetical protein